MKLFSYSFSFIARLEDLSSSFFAHFQGNIFGTVAYEEERGKLKINTTDMLEKQSSPIFSLLGSNSAASAKT